MKWIGYGKFLGIVGLLAGLSGAEMTKESSAQLIRSDLEQSFAELTANSIEGLKKALADNEWGVKGEPASGFEIDEVSTPVQTDDARSSVPSPAASIMSKLGIKIWFELSDGTLVNPVKRRWKQRERFYIHVQAAVPVYVTLYQSSPRKKSVSTQTYPHVQYPESFKVIQPGQSTRLPVLFEMDDDTQAEVMSMVVVRADWEVIQRGLNMPVAASVINRNGTAQITARITPSGTGMMKCVNDRIIRKQAWTVKETLENIGNLQQEEAEEITRAINVEAEQAKLQIVGSSMATSRQPNDVCFYMFGKGNVGQWQMTILK